MVHQFVEKYSIHSVSAAIGFYFNRHVRQFHSLISVSMQI